MTTAGSEGPPWFYGRTGRARIGISVVRCGLRLTPSDVIPRRNSKQNSTHQIEFHDRLHRGRDDEKARCFSRSANSRSWPMTTDIALRRYFRTWGLSRHCADCREAWRLHLVTGSLIGSGPCSSSGSLAKFTAIRRAPSRVSSLAAARRPGSSSK